jgi:hypothetical protein
MFVLLNVLVGVGLGTLCALLGFVCGFLTARLCPRKEKTVKPKKSELIHCGSCRSPIVGQPVNVVLTEKDSFKYYRCGQCGTTVTVPL